MHCTHKRRPPTTPISQIGFSGARALFACRPLGPSHPRRHPRCSLLCRCFRQQATLALGLLPLDPGRGSSGFIGAAVALRMVTKVIGTVVAAICGFMARLVTLLVAIWLSAPVGSFSCHAFPLHSKGCPWPTVPRAALEAVAVEAAFFIDLGCFL